MQAILIFIVIPVGTTTSTRGVYTKRENCLLRIMRCKVRVCGTSIQEGWADIRENMATYTGQKLVSTIDQVGIAVRKRCHTIKHH